MLTFCVILAWTGLGIGGLRGGVWQWAGSEDGGVSRQDVA